MNDLVERLREYAENAPYGKGLLPSEVADTIERLQSELAALNKRVQVAWSNREGTKFCGNDEKFKHKDCVIPLYTSPTTTDRDAERLDWLDAQNERKNKHHGTKYGWKYSENCNRIALEDHGYPVMTVREAIDAAMQEGK